MRARLLTAGLVVLGCWVAVLSWTGLVERPSGFLAPLAVSGVLMVAVGGVVRLRWGGPLTALPAQVVVLAVWLHRIGTGHWWPGHTSWHVLTSRLAEGSHVAEVQNSPVAVHLPEMHLLLLVSATGLLLLGELLAGGLRRPLLGGLPMLVAIAIPSSALTDSLPITVLGGAVLLWLAAIGVDHNRVPRRGVLLPATAIVGGVLVLGSTVPQVTPVTRVAGNKSGTDTGQDLVLDNPFLDLRRNLSEGQRIPLVYATTSAADTSYLRLAVLDQFDGSSWAPSTRQPDDLHPAQGDLPTPEGLTLADTGRRNTWTLHVSPAFKSSWLPLPFPTLSLSAEGDWEYDQKTLDVNGFGGQTAAGATYTAESAVRPVESSRLTAPDNGLNAPPPGMTALPQTLPSIFGELARQITRGATSEYARAVRLQNWFRTGGGFRYSLAPGGGYGIDELVRFVTVDKVGYCEQFAATMAIMARTLGIPARVGVGFLSGHPVGNQLVYTTRDMHAWPELYFPQAGWLPFEPTPAARAQQVPSYTVPSVANHQPSPKPTTTPSTAPKSSSSSKPPVPLPGTSGRGHVAGLSLRTLGMVGLVLLVLLLLALPRLLRVARRRRRWSSAESPAALAEVAWREVRDSARDAGMSWSDRQTVRGTVQTLTRQARADATAVDALGEVARFVELSRYARPDTAGYGPAEVARLRHEVEGWVREWDAGVLRALDGPSARRARWLPRSLTRR